MGKKLNEPVEKSSSVLTIHGDSFNTASTLKLTDNEVISKSTTNGLTISDKETSNEVIDVAKGTSDKGALVHLVKSSLGSGILAMPGAFSHSGTIFGLIGTVLVGLLCTHCVHLLVWCSQTLSARVKKPHLGFAETAEEAFKGGPSFMKKYAPIAREFVNTALLATYYLGNTVYIVFIAESLQQVVQAQLGIEYDIRIYILMVAVPLIPLGMIRHLKYLVPFSAIATAFILVGLGITVYFILSDLSDTAKDVVHITKPSDWPLFFSTVLFAMEGIGTVLPIENSMKKPDHFLGCPGVLNIAMSFIVTLYTLVGFFGYIRYGGHTKASVTLNLGKSWLAEVVKILVALSILFTYGLQFTVPTEIVWKKIRGRFSEEKHTISYYIMRVLMILGTIIIAIILPQLGPFINLVGAVCFSLLGLLCPAIIEAATHYEEGYGFLRWRLVKDVIIVIISITALISGSYASIFDIIKFYKGDNQS